MSADSARPIPGNDAFSPAAAPPPRLAGASGVATFAVAVAAFMVAELWIGARTASVGVFLFALMVAMTQTLAGLLALRVGAMQDVKARLPAAFCVGFVCITLPMYAVSSLLAVSALWAFAACAALVLLMLLLPDPRAAVRTLRAEPPAGVDLLVTGALACAVLVLTRTSVGSARALEVTDAFPLWSDYFLHGVTIASFGGPFGSGTDMEVLGVSRVFYHYATFMLPAAFQPITGATGLALATSVLLPLGVLTAGLGCYVFVAQLGGKAVGWLAVVVAGVVPVYRVPLQSGLLDFHWLFLATPGSGYAIGLAMLACVAAMQCVEHGGTRRFCFLGLLLISIVLVRVHFFMLIAPAIAMYVALHRHWISALRALVLLGLAALLLFAVVSVSPAIADWLASQPAPVQYLDGVLAHTLFMGRPIGLPADSSVPMFVVKTALTLIALLGIYAFVYPVLAIAAALRFGLKDADRLVLCLLLSYVGLMLFAPTAGNADFTEYKHRHFPLVYVLVALVCVLHICRLATAHGRASAWQDRAAVVLSVVILGAAAMVTRGSDPAKPDVKAMPWSADFYGEHVAAGLVDAARFMRAQARPGDILALGGDAVSGNSRMIVDLISMTDIPAFLARSELRMLRGPCVQQTLEQRTRALKNIAAAADWSQARQRMRENAIRWFVVPSGEPAAWDPARQGAAYASHGLSVYDAGVRAQGAQPPTETCH